MSASGRECPCSLSLAGKIPVARDHWLLDILLVATSLKAFPNSTASSGLGHKGNVLDNEIHS